VINSAWNTNYTSCNAAKLTTLILYFRQCKGAQSFIFSLSQQVICFYSNTSKAAITYFSGPGLKGVRHCRLGPIFSYHTINCTPPFVWMVVLVSHASIVQVGVLDHATIGVLTHSVNHCFLFSFSNIFSYNVLFNSLWAGQNGSWWGLVLVLE